MEKLFELRRRTFDTPHFRGIEFIEVEAKSIINSVPGNYLPFNWTINAYRGCSHACVYCFARTTHTYLDMNAGSDFDTKIVVKVNAPEVLRKDLRKKSWKGEHIAMGTATDPYQRAEGKYKITRSIVETLLEFRNPFSILTKGTLILRDLDLLVEASRLMEVSTAFSIGTLDEDVWRKSEPGTPHPRKRIEAVAKLNEAGIPCGVLVAPVLPGISDSEAQLREVVTAAIDAGATHVSPILLHLRPVVRDVYMGWLQETYPDLVPRYNEMYAKAYGPTSARNSLGKMVSSIVSKRGGPKGHSALRERARERRLRAKRAAEEAERLKTEQFSLI
jgi:DNA repair photolyase